MADLVVQEGPIPDDYWVAYDTELGFRFVRPDGGSIEPVPLLMKYAVMAEGVVLFLFDMSEDIRTMLRLADVFLGPQAEVVIKTYAIEDADGRPFWCIDVDLASRTFGRGYWPGTEEKVASDLEFIVATRAGLRKIARDQREVAKRLQGDE